MDTGEPTRDHLDRGRAEHLHGDEETARRHHEQWKEQAQQIEDDMADAVERAAAMGDRVEPSLLPPDRRPDDPSADGTPAEDRNSLGDPEGVGHDRSGGEARGT